MSETRCGILKVDLMKIFLWFNLELLVNDVMHSFCLRLMTLGKGALGCSHEGGPKRSPDVSFNPRDLNFYGKNSNPSEKFKMSKKKSRPFSKKWRVPLTGVLRGVDFCVFEKSQKSHKNPNLIHEGAFNLVPA